MEQVTRSPGHGWRLHKKLIREQNLIAVGDFVHRWKDGIYEKKLTPYELHELVHREGYMEATRSQRQER